MAWSTCQSLRATRWRHLFHSSRSCWVNAVMYKSYVRCTVVFGETLRENRARTPTKVSSCWQESVSGFSTHCNLLLESCKSLNTWHNICAFTCNGKRGSLRPKLNAAKCLKALKCNSPWRAISEASLASNQAPPR